jgi:hypothetical protein
MFATDIISDATFRGLGVASRKQTEGAREYATEEAAAGAGTGE